MLYLSDKRFWGARPATKLSDTIQLCMIRARGGGGAESFFFILDEKDCDGRGGAHVGLPFRKTAAYSNC